MRRRPGRQLSTWCVLLCILSAGFALLGGGRIAAQEEESPETAGLAGGQMVRGAVISISISMTGDHLAIKTDKGASYQVAVSSNTRIVKDRQPVRITEVRVGDSVGAMGVLDAPTRTVHALFLMIISADQVKQMRDGLGKVYIAGKVTAIDELRLTIQRPDGVSQIIAVDESTSFRKGGRPLQAMIDGSGTVPNSGPRSSANAGESITLLDIKAGDTVAGKGELKNGIFVPTELAIMDPAARQRRRHPDGSVGVGAPPTLAEPK